MTIRAKSQTSARRELRALPFSRDTAPICSLPNHATAKLHLAYPNTTSSGDASCPRHTAVEQAGSLPRPFLGVSGALLARRTSAAPSLRRLPNQFPGFVVVHRQGHPKPTCGRPRGWFPGLSRLILQLTTQGVGCSKAEAAPSSRLSYHKSLTSVVMTCHRDCQRLARPCVMRKPVVVVSKRPPRQGPCSGCGIFSICPSRNLIALG